MKKHTITIILFGLVNLLIFSDKSNAAGDGTKGKAIFDQKCVLCHTIGEGKRIGPDLAGVVDRRKAEWLKEFISNPEKMINVKKDPVAVKLFNDYGKIPMVVSPPLTPEEIEHILKYLQDATKGKIPKA